MDAKTRNESYHRLFTNGGRLDILLWAYQEAEDEPEVTRLDFGHQTIKECPCGCGLENDVCEERKIKMKKLADEIPF